MNDTMVQAIGRAADKKLMEDAGGARPTTDREMRKAFGLVRMVIVWPSRGQLRASSFAWSHLVHCADDEPIRHFQL